MAKKQALVLRTTSFGGALVLGPGDVVEAEARELKAYVDDGSIDPAPAAVANALAGGAKPITLSGTPEAKQPAAD